LNAPHEPRLFGLKAAAKQKLSAQLNFGGQPLKTDYFASFPRVKKLKLF